LTHCNGICIKHKPINTKSRQDVKKTGYKRGYTWCVTCQIYMTIKAGSRCPCCNILTRKRPRSTHSRINMEHKRY